MIKTLFPNAKISLDRFHLVQLINRSFNKTRVRIMNQYKSSNERYYNKLKVAYEVYQEILISIQDRKFNKFKTIIGEFYSLSNTLMKTSLKTFKKYLEYIENSLKYNYNNGLIEGINRKK